MNTRNIVHVLVLLSLLVPFVSTVPVLASEAQQDSGPGAYVPGEVVVGFTPGRDLPLYVEGATALAASVGGQVLRVSSTGAALLRLPAGADVEGVARSLSSTRGVIFAEPNFIYSVPDPVIEDRHGNPDYSRDVDKDGEVRVVPTQLLRSMKSIRRGKTQTTYPSDPMLWWNNGWDWMQADYIWPNTTVAKNVCVLDTGVDYLHKDLTTTRVLKGKDWVNNDVDPMDDNGHGTHIAGIISALGNNKEGISGVSNGKVVAVKVIGAQGWGTNFDISQGIYECANRTDVNVLNMSFGGSDESTLMQAAIDWAVNTKGKLVVAAAGNDGSSSPIFPAGWSADFPGKLMAVGALGKWIPVDWDEDLVVDWYDVDNTCKADYSNYGDWVNMWAPGTDIFSTTPWDKPFWLNWYEGVDVRYGWMSGTSMATPFASAAAARTWGVFPAYTNSQIYARVRGNPRSMWPESWSRYVGPADDDCWPASTDIDGLRSLNVAGPMGRGLITGIAYEARTGTPLVGATVQLLTLGGSLIGSSIIPTNTSTCVGCVPPTYVWFDDFTNILNVPAADGGTSYHMKITKTGYTSGAQAAFLDDLEYGAAWIYPGIGWADVAFVPPMNSDHTFVASWDWGFSENDIDLNVWLPGLPKGVPDGQPSPFIVGPEGDDFGTVVDDPAGAMTVFPFARWNRDGGYGDWLAVESVTVRARAAVPALPYYTGEYIAVLTDYGQWVDLEPTNGIEDPGEALLGQVWPRLQIWQGGKLKAWLVFGCSTADHWWTAASVDSGASGAATYTLYDTCGGSGSVPYFAEGFSGRVEIQK